VLRPIFDAHGLDENRDAGRFLTAFDALLIEADIPEALIVHHMGHQGERSRGDSRLRDWPDVEWFVRKDGDDDMGVRYFRAFGRDVAVPLGTLVYDFATRHLSYMTGNKADAKAKEALPIVLGILDEATEPLTQASLVIKALAVRTTTRITKEQARQAIQLGIENGEIGTRPGERNSILHYRATQKRISPG
jgi:hypothetical protein